MGTHASLNRRELMAGAALGAGAVVGAPALEGLAAQRGLSVLTGTVDRVNRRRRTLQLSTTTRGDRTVRVARDAVLWRGVPVALSAFRRGDEITVEGRRRGDTFVAERVTSTFRIVEGTLTARSGNRLTTDSAVIRLTPATLPMAAPAPTPARGRAVEPTDALPDVGGLPDPGAPVGVALPDLRPGAPLDTLPKDLAVGQRVVAQGRRDAATGELVAFRIGAIV